MKDALTTCMVLLAITGLAQTLVLIEAHKQLKIKVLRGLTYGLVATTMLLAVAGLALLGRSGQ